MGGMLENPLESTRDLKGEGFSGLKGRDHRRNAQLWGEQACSINFQEKDRHHALCLQTVA